MTYFELHINETIKHAFLYVSKEIKMLLKAGTNKIKWNIPKTVMEFIFDDYIMRGLPSGSIGIEFACNAGDLGSTPRLGRSPGGGHGNPLQYSCPENPQRQRNLEGCSPWWYSG